MYISHMLLNLTYSSNSLLLDPGSILICWWIREHSEQATEFILHARALRICKYKIC